MASVIAMVSSPAFAQLTNTIVTSIFLGADIQPVDGRFWALNKDYIDATPSIEYGGSPAGTTITSLVLENSIPTLETGDTVVNLIEKGTGQGTVSHEGFYSVSSEAVTLWLQYEAVMPGLRTIPHPFASSAGGAAAISWAAAVDDANAGNIVGYNIWRSTDGINFNKLNTVPITGTSTTDATVTPGSTYVYALSILFRGTLSTPEVESRYISGNSNPVTIGTPGVSIISVTPYFALQNTLSLNVSIEGQNTNFNGSSIVSFEGLNHVVVNSVNAVSSTEIIANIDVPLAAQPGPRNVVVRTNTGGPTDEVAVGPNMFWVIPNPITATFTLTPPKGVRSFFGNVVAHGTNTNFLQGGTVSYFGPEIKVNSTTVSSSELATVNISVSTEAAYGVHFAFMWTGTEVAVGTFEVAAADIPSGVIPNFPNPFDPINPDPDQNHTHIIITLDQPTNVGVYVYDITARQVWKYVQFLPAGQSQVVWNGYTYYNRVADNGVYLLRVVDEGTKKLIGKGKILVVKK